MVKRCEGSEKKRLRLDQVSAANAEVLSGIILEVAGWGMVDSIRNFMEGTVADFKHKVGIQFASSYY